MTANHDLLESNATLRCVHYIFITLLGNLLTEIIAWILYSVLSKHLTANLMSYDHTIIILITFIDCTLIASYYAWLIVL